MKNCIDCGEVVPIKNTTKRCNKCKYIKYGKSNRSKATPHIDKTITSIKDCLKWVEECQRRNYNVGALDLYRMVGIYEGLGGQMRCLDDYDTTIQLSMMWEFIFKEYNTIKSGGNDFFERRRIRLLDYHRAYLKIEKNDF